MDVSCSTMGGGEKCQKTSLCVWKTWRGDMGAHGRIILQWNLRKKVVCMWTGFIWLRMCCSGWLLWTRLWAFGFFKSKRISLPLEWPSASQKELCSNRFISFTSLKWGTLPIYLICMFLYNIQKNVTVWTELLHVLPVLNVLFILQ